MSRPYAEVIGDPIAQSKSPVIHGFWLDQLGLDAAYRKTLVTADDLPAFFAARRDDLDWRGCNITMPHKLAAARAQGLETVDGLEMLIGQAALAFELFFGAEPPRDRDDELRDLLLA